MGLWYAEISNRLQSSSISKQSICSVIEMVPARLNMTYTEIEITTTAFSLVECNDVINPSTFLDGIFAGVANTVGFVILANIIKYVNNSTLMSKFFIV